MSRGQLSPIAVREASVMLLQPDTQRICSLWHPLHRLTRPSSVICWREAKDTQHKSQKLRGIQKHPWNIDICLLSQSPANKCLPYCARLHIDGCEFWAVFLKVFQSSIIQLGKNKTCSISLKNHTSIIDECDFVNQRVEIKPNVTTVSSDLQGMGHWELTVYLNKENRKGFTLKKKIQQAGSTAWRKFRPHRSRGGT